MPLPTTEPRHAGIDAQGVLDLLDGVAHLDIHSLAIARRGHVLARGWWAPYAPELRQLVYSVSKSVTATTVATLVEEGRLGLDDPVLDHLPPQALAAAGAVAESWRGVTVRHCLTMTVGHPEEAWSPHIAAAQEPLVPILAAPPTHEPGTVFAYNQVATYLVSRAAEHRGGAPLDALARELVLSRLGETDMVWETDRAGHPWGFSGVRIRTEELLDLTQLWLDRGAVAGEQVVPQTWVAEASAPYLPLPQENQSDWSRGYGQSFWTSRYGYRADGAFGQLGLVLPEHELAIALTSEVEDMGELLDLIWRHVVPAVDREGSEAADARLRERLAALRIPSLRTSAAAPQRHQDLAVDPASDVTGVRGVQIDADGGALTLARDGGAIRLEVGDGDWRTAALSVDGRTLRLSASGGWTESGYRAEVRVIETPHSFRVETGSAGALLRWRLQPLNGTDVMIGATP